MAKTGLGRGLGALLGGQNPPETAEAPADSPSETQLVSTETVRQVSIDSVQPCPSQPRKDFERQPLEELAESIKVNGILQPMVARTTEGGQLELIAGERRWRAAQIAGLKTVPVIVREASDSQVLELALVENLQREDLNPLEEALALRRLVDEFDMTHGDAAELCTWWLGRRNGRHFQAREPDNPRGRRAGRRGGHRCGASPRSCS